MPASSETARVGKVQFTFGVVGSGRSVLVLPGSGGWQLTCEPLVRALAAERRVIALDPPGQGRTEVVGEGFSYTVDSVVDAIAEFVRDLDVGPLAVAGHSWGGGYALRLAQRHPGLASALLLVAPAGMHEHDPWEFRALRLPLVGELATRLSTEYAVKYLLRKAQHDSSTIADRAQRVAAAGWLRGSRRARRDLLAVERAADWSGVRADLGLVDVPVQIVWGDQDRYYPSNLIDAFLEQLPCARGTTIKDAGHSPHADAPEEFQRIALKFLAEVDT